MLRLSALLVVLSFGLLSTSDSRFNKHEKAYFADAATVNFVRPGLIITVNSASVAADGTIATTFTVTDPQGLPLDRTGVTTPGAISLSFVAAYIPKGQEQYTAYTTRPASGAAIPSTNQAGSDSGGIYNTVATGQYTYTFNTRAPSGFDTGATHTIGIYGSRNLTEFSLGTNYASTTYNFVPNGSAVTTTRDVIRTSSCNKCHDQLSAHGGSRRGMNMCVLCHQPQTLDPDTGNTVDFKVMVHKIHMGSQLPSVQAGKPYRLIGFNGAVSDWSTVVFPADIRRCESCHEQGTGAAQANVYLTKPAETACGSCHDDVNFRTGVNHAGGPQINDDMCANCHIPQGELPFDASIIGAHTIPSESSLLGGLAVAIKQVTSELAGNKPTVTFTVQDGKGAALALSNLSSLSFTMAGPTTDYGYTSFGSDVTTAGYVTESALRSSCDAQGLCTYTFTHAVPAQAKGTYAIGVEARRTETLLPGTTTAMTVTYGARNQVVYFSTDGTPLAARRTVVSTDNCNQCHAALSLHGSLRNQTEYCVFCHNPSNTDAATRAMAQNPADKAAPPQGIAFPLMVHRIHTGENMVADGGSYTVVGFGGSHNDFSTVRYAPMSPQGTPGDTRNCAICHVNDSEARLPVGLNDVVNPQGWINPSPATSAACSGCHVAKDAASHFLSMTTSLGESCTVCHESGSAFDVNQVHAQY
jgi:OmcA/MtrC family decaheme c-type cytochrome